MTGNLAKIIVVAHVAFISTMIIIAWELLKLICTHAHIHFSWGA